MELRLLLRSLVGIAATFGVWHGLARMIVIDPAAGTAQRLGFALAALLPAVTVLNLIVLAQMRLRMAARAVDPLAGKETHLLQVNQRALTNTVEQLVGFAPALLALAAGAPANWMPHVIAAGLVFGLARLVFWGGYLLGPMWRAPGMAATFAINVTTLLAAVVVWWP